MIRRFGRLGWLLLPLLAACNLNASADVSSQPITGAPLMQIVSPLPNATYLEGVAVNIQALISNAGPDIDRVEISVDDTIIASLTQPNEAGAPAFSVTESWPAAGTGAHTISVVAVRGDGVASDPASVTFTIVNQVSQPQGQSVAPPNSNAPTSSSQSGSNTQAAPAQPSNTPAPTNSPQPQASNTPDVPMATFLTGVNVRRGPDTIFDPPIGSIAANDTSEVLAVNPARTWYKVKYYNGEGWVFGNLLTIAGGDENSLPIEAGPPTPTPVPPTATPVPVTATPQLNVNLVAGNVTTNPGTITCKETFQVFVDIANFGSTRSPGGEIRVRDEANGLRTETVGAFGEIDPGQTRNFGPIPLTVDTNHGVEHTLTVIVDSNNAIAELNEDDNRNNKKYTLQRGAC